MNRRTFVKTLPTLTVLASTTVGFTQDTPKAPQDLKPITLPKPDMDGGKSVLAALKERKTTRNISTKELPAPGPIKPALGSLRSEPGEWAHSASLAGPPRRQATRRKSICTSLCPRVFIFTKPLLTGWHLL